MAKKQPITEEQKAKALLSLQRRATETSFDGLLSSNILADLADPRASVSLEKRSGIRALLGLPEIMEVNYDLSFEEMLVQAGIPQTSIIPVMAKLGSKKIEFDYRGKVIFEYADVGFGRSVTTKMAVDHIDGFDKEWAWHPFCIAQLLVYIRRHPERFYSNFVLAVGKTIELDGKQHVFGVGTVGGKPDLGILPAHGHTWDKKTRFPKSRKV